MSDKESASRNVVMAKLAVNAAADTLIQLGKKLPTLAPQYLADELCEVRNRLQQLAAFIDLLPGE